MKPLTIDALHTMVKDIEQINQLFARLLDKPAFELVRRFRKRYQPYGYTVSFDEDSRLVLLERLQGQRKKESELVG